MSKYQEALKRLKTNEYLTSREQRQYYNLLQELVDKEKIYDELTNELGCPLDVVFKAILQNHIYIQMYDRDEKGKIYEPKKLVMYKQENVCLSRTKNHNPDVWCLSFWGGWNNLWVACAYLKDYKKTWWLRSDLEEE